MSTNHKVFIYFIYILLQWEAENVDSHIVHCINLFNTESGRMCVHELKKYHPIFSTTI